MLIHVNRGLIQVKHFPWDCVAILSNRRLRKMRHQGPADTFAPKLRSDEKIFEEDSRSSLPRRIVVEVEGHASRFSIQFCNDHVKLWARSESVAAQILFCTNDCVRCPLIFGQLSNEREDQWNILGGCCAKLQQSRAV